MKTTRAASKGREGREGQRSSGASEEGFGGLPP